MKSIISVNLKKDKIIFNIAEDAKHDDIIRILNRKLPSLKKLYKEEKTPITIVGKVLKNSEMDEIKDIIKKEIDVDIEFDMPKALGLSSIKRTFKQEVGVSETKFHKGSLRSGQRIETEGSIVIIGDVNFGAEVIASDNIAVLGTLRGLAHAGAKGNEKAIVAASKLEALQVRIANIVKEVTDEERENDKQVYISVINNKIVVE